MPQPPTAPKTKPLEDPNFVRQGARQRVGPFWLEEPRWFWVVAVTAFLLGLAIFLLAVSFDRP